MCEAWDQQHDSAVAAWAGQGIILLRPAAVPCCHAMHAMLSDPTLPWYPNLQPAAPPCLHATCHLSPSTAQPTQRTSLTLSAPSPAPQQQLLPHANNKERGIGLLNALKVMDRLKAAQAALGRGVASASGSRNTPSDLKRQLDEQMGVVEKLGRWVAAGVPAFDDVCCLRAACAAGGEAGHVGRWRCLRLMCTVYVHAGRSRSGEVELGIMPSHQSTSSSYLALSTCCDTSSHRAFTSMKVHSCSSHARTVPP